MTAKSKADSGGDLAPIPVRLPKCEIAQRPLSEIREADGNSKLHPVEQVERLAESIERFGFVNPVLITGDGELVAGHGRLAAARRLGLAEIPVIVLDGLTPDQVRALRIADNRLPEMSEWNVDLLHDELRHLQGSDFDLKAVGFTDEEVDGLMDLPAPDDPGAADPEDDEGAVSQPGDVWIAGRHRLVCGDPATADAVSTAMEGKGRKPHMLLTDHGRSGSEDPDAVFALCDLDVAYVVAQPMEAAGAMVAMEAAGWTIRTQLMWDKERMAGRGKRYRLEHEVILYAVRKSRKSHWIGDRKQSSMWVFGDAGSAGIARPLNPPPELFAKALKNNSARGEAFLDPWLGAGRP